ncbi:MAG: Abi family protein, partial [Acutalibacteraceae bacterium]
KTPMLYKQYTEEGISNLRIYAVLLCLKHLLPNGRHWDEFIDTIELLFDKYPHVKKELMGFPKNNWKDFLL